jgi:hypothetical protein
LQLVAARCPGHVQLVFSVADLKAQLEATDEVWIPNFTIEGEPCFLGLKPAPEASARMAFREKPRAANL